MKVDVITRHAVANYGSILQTYATQSIIESLGFDCNIINYVREDEKGKNIWKMLLKRSKKWNKNFITRSIYKAIQSPNYTYSYNKFLQFRKKLLKETREYNSIKELREEIPEADVYCTGSDQVWGNIGNVPYDETYFLKFVPKYKKCIAYSASFGKEINDERMLSNLNYLLEDYKSILVRENTAVDIIKKTGIDNVKQVLDPTLLLDKEKLSNLTTNIKEKKEYVLVYQLHDNKKFEKYAKKFAKKAKLKLIRISPAINNIFKSGNTVFMPTPQEFLSYIKNARYIITDSFHGTVFSILFNKDFIDILPGKSATRIESMLSLTCLEDRILKDYNDFSFINKKIEFENVNDIIKEQRKRSINLLKEAIVN